MEISRSECFQSFRRLQLLFAFAFLTSILISYVRCSFGLVLLSDIMNDFHELYMRTRIAFRADWRAPLKSHAEKCIHWIQSAVEINVSPI